MSLADDVSALAVSAPQDRGRSWTGRAQEQAGAPLPRPHRDPLRWLPPPQPRRRQRPPPCSQLPRRQRRQPPRTSPALKAAYHRQCLGCHQQMGLKETGLHRLPRQGRPQERRQAMSISRRGFLGAAVRRAPARSASAGTAKRRRSQALRRLPRPLRAAARHHALRGLPLLRGRLQRGQQAAQRRRPPVGTMSVFDKPRRTTHEQATPWSTATARPSKGKARRLPQAAVHALQRALLRLGLPRQGLHQDPRGAGALRPGRLRGLPLLRDGLPLLRAGLRVRRSRRPPG